jgi:hypothetical protein
VQPTVEWDAAESHDIAWASEEAPIRSRDKVAKCGALPDAGIFYRSCQVTGTRRGSSHDDESDTRKRETEESVSFTFDNLDGGGTEGTAQRTEAVALLVAEGCNQRRQDLRRNSYQCTCRHTPPG